MHYLGVQQSQIHPLVPEQELQYLCTAVLGCNHGRRTPLDRVQNLDLVEHPDPFFIF